MTNFDRALAVLEDARRPGDLRIHPNDAVEALAQAGLLAPDLPPLSSDYASIEVPTRRTLIMNDDDYPTLYENEDSILVGTVNGEVNFSLGVHDEVSVTLPVDKAVNFSLAVLAAAQYSKEEA